MVQSAQLNQLCFKLAILGCYNKDMLNQLEVPEINGIIPANYTSHIDGLQFHYEGPRPWDKSPLMLFSDLDAAVYPPTTHIPQPHLNEELQIPNYDMLIRLPGLPPVLFTEAHSRVLYEAKREGLLPPSINRVVVNLDKHEDFARQVIPPVEFDPSTLEIGNWIAAGAALGYVGRVLHFSEHNGKSLQSPEQRLVHGVDGNVITTIPFYKAHLLDIPHVGEYLNRVIPEGGTYIVTIDVDGYPEAYSDITDAEYAKDYSAHNGNFESARADDEARRLSLERNITLQKSLIDTARQDKRCELIQYVVSSGYSTPKVAHVMWDALRQQLKK